MERSRLLVLSAMLVALGCTLWAPLLATAAEDAGSDERAAARLAAMANTLAKAPRLQTTIDANWDVTQPSGEKIEFGETRVITMRRPDRLRVETTRRDGRRRVFLFDGTQLAVSDPDLKVYATEPRPGTLDAALDHLTEDLHMRMPLHELFAADLAKKLASVGTPRWVDADTIAGTATDHVLSGATARTCRSGSPRRGTRCPGVSSSPIARRKDSRSSAPASPSGTCRPTCPTACSRSPRQKERRRSRLPFRAPQRRARHRRARRRRVDDEDTTRTGSRRGGGDRRLGRGRGRARRWTRRRRWGGGAGGGGGGGFSRGGPAGGGSFGGAGGAPRGGGGYRTGGAAAGGSFGGRPSAGSYAGRGGSPGGGQGGAQVQQRAAPTRDTSGMRQPDAAAAQQRQGQRAQNTGQRQDQRAQNTGQRQDQRAQNTGQRQDQRDQAREDWQKYGKNQQQNRQEFADDYYDDNGRYMMGTTTAAATLARPSPAPHRRRRRVGAVAAGAAATGAAPAASPPGWTHACTPTTVTVGGNTYYQCGSAWYTRAYHGSDVAYVASNPPPGY